MTQTPSTCPAPSTTRPASTSLLHADADASGRPIAADARCEYCRQVGNGCSLARCRNPPPRRAAQPAAPTATAPKVLRDVQVSCRCEGYLKGEAPPREPLALVRLAKTEADAVEHLHRALCYRNSIEARRDDGEDLEDEVSAAYTRQNKIEQHVADKWGVSVVLQHDI